MKNLTFSAVALFFICIVISTACNNDKNKTAKKIKNIDSNIVIKYDSSTDAKTTTITTTTTITDGDTSKVVTKIIGSPK